MVKTIPLHNMSRARALSQIMPQITHPTLKKRGFLDVDMLKHWRAIVGDELAAFSHPEKLQRRGREGATLAIRVEGAMALEVQHLTPQILDRINNYFGRNLVQRLTITQIMQQMPTPSTKPQEPSQAVLDKITTQFSDMPESALKTALIDLGVQVYMHNNMQSD